MILYVINLPAKADKVSGLPDGLPVEAGASRCKTEMETAVRISISLPSCTAARAEDVDDVTMKIHNESEQTRARLTEWKQPVRTPGACHKPGGVAERAYPQARGSEPLRSSQHMHSATQRTAQRAGEAVRARETNVCSHSVESEPMTALNTLAYHWRAMYEFPGGSFS